VVDLCERLGRQRCVRINKNENLASARASAHVAGTPNVSDGFVDNDRAITSSYGCRLVGACVINDYDLKLTLTDTGENRGGLL
jgi:hypothetical protein